MTAARVLHLEEHGRRVLEAYTEPLLDAALADGRRRRAQEAADRGLYGHLWEALERWQQQGELPDAP